MVPVTPMNSKKSEKNISSLVLLAKRPGRTSFSSLFSVKHALSTTKVGHTGTLDSFAEGLLVVCTGSLTRLASRITAFDKEYEAIIAFGKETDTLDPFGEVIRETELPEKADFLRAFEMFKGELMQRPPAFSAIHVDGQRSSDLARKGLDVEIPARPIKVFSSRILELKEENGRVSHAHVKFHVSKGTYIRSLARDIALECGSSGHLAGLLRTKVGSFSLSDAAGAEFLKSFDIQRVTEELKAEKNNEPQKDEAQEKAVQEEILLKKREMTPDVALECGFCPIFLKDGYENHFRNGKPLSEKLFVDVPEDRTEYAVFSGGQDNAVFSGIIERTPKYMKYIFVVPDCQ